MSIIRVDCTVCDWHAGLDEKRAREHDRDAHSRAVSEHFSGELHRDNVQKYIAGAFVVVVAGEARK